MKKFWANGESLNETETRLLAELLHAHARCVWRDNCSTAALQQAAGGSRKLGNAVIAALSTLGEVHGPVESAYEFLQHYRMPEDVYKLLHAGERVPGFGNSFIKNQIDPAFAKVDSLLASDFPKEHSRLAEVTGVLHVKNKMLFPNPAAYTATTALILGMPKELCPLLFLMGRLESWAELFHMVVMKNPIRKEGK